VVALLGAFASTASPARADERWLLSGEASYAQPLTDPQKSLFGPGLSGSVAVHRSFVPWVSLGLRLRAAYLFDGDPPPDTGRVDPDGGTLFSAGAALRLRPLADRSDPRRGSGLWLEGVGGGGLTGDRGRAVFEAGLGWNFAVGSVLLGPSARYVQVIETKSNLDGRDARLFLFGLEVMGPDPGSAPATVEPEPEPEGPVDSDGDGLIDPEDGCPQEPEDADGFEDGDGCPDEDNDGDGVLDVDDGCPLEPEDADGFEDDDGCPDLDNDADGLKDEEDRCPNEPEVVNGVDDHDGCPDEGVIELIDDRIVLEERVLFDKERAKLKPGARRVLEAIVELWRQHPEWARLRVEGHADVRGEEEYNQELSARRARVTMDKLVEFGIPADIIESKGYGASRPRDRRRTRAAHQRNRRVEFVVVARHEEIPDERHPGGGDTDDAAAGPSGGPQ
jgi:outer membrane protein OmpA-like peptidoglycan-associated protein